MSDDDVIPVASVRLGRCALEDGHECVYVAFVNEFREVFARLEMPASDARRLQAKLGELADLAEVDNLKTKGRLS